MKKKTQDARKKYVVRLDAENREQLEALIRKGKSPAQRLLKARILSGTGLSCRRPARSSSSALSC